MRSRSWQVWLLTGLFLVTVQSLTGCKKDEETSSEEAAEEEALPEEEQQEEESSKNSGTDERKQKRGPPPSRKKTDKPESEAGKRDELAKAPQEKARGGPLTDRKNRAPTKVPAAGEETAKSGAEPVPEDKRRGHPTAGDEAHNDSTGRDHTGRHNKAQVVPPPVRIPVARYLTVADLNEHLAEKGWIAYGPIQGLLPSETFNSLNYRRPGTNRFVSLLVWDFKQYDKAVAKWNELLATYPNAQELKDMFARFIFFSYRNQINTLAFIHVDKAMVLAVSCHSEVCDDTSLYKLANAVNKRVNR